MLFFCHTLSAIFQTYLPTLNVDVLYGDRLVTSFFSKIFSLYLLVCKCRINSPQTRSPRNYIICNASIFWLPSLYLIEVRSIRSVWKKIRRPTQVEKGNFKPQTRFNANHWNFILLLLPKIVFFMLKPKKVEKRPKPYGEKSGVSAFECKWFLEQFKWEPEPNISN